MLIRSAKTKNPSKPLDTGQMRKIKHVGGRWPDGGAGSRRRSHWDGARRRSGALPGDSPGWQEGDKRRAARRRCPLQLCVGKVGEALARTAGEGEERVGHQNEQAGSSRRKGSRTGMGRRRGGDGCKK